MRSCGEDRSVCDRNADCQYNNQFQEYRCHCHYGFIGDGYQCDPAPVHEGPFILFAQGMTILRMTIPDNENAVSGYPLITKPHQITVGLDVDCLNGYIFWSDVHNGTILRAPYNGSLSETVSPSHISSEDTPSAPEGIAIDWVSRNIYWTDSKRKTVEVSNLDGSLHKVLINEKLANPRGIAVHPGRWDNNVQCFI